MERKFINNCKLDDTELLSATIERSLTTQGHTEYVIRVQRGPLATNCWRTKKRYNDFVDLQTALHLSNGDLPLPPKKIFGNMEREFINQRQQGLQNYLNVLLANTPLASTLPVKKFLDPVNYFYNFQEKSYQQVLMLFRSDPLWTVVEPVSDIGWRIRKQYYVARQLQDPLQDYLLSRSTYGPDFCLSEKESSLVAKYLNTISHPLILNPAVASFDTGGGIAVYKYYKEGSLKDYIYKSHPKASYIKKYRRTKLSSALTREEIKRFGKQILEALYDLHSKGLPYGHLHSGNVFVDNGVCRISSVENIFLGQSPFYRSFATQLKKVKTLCDMDVYSFGHIMYEMAFGQCLNTPTCDTWPSSCIPEIKCVLESILTTEACKGGLPTIEHLLTHPLFGDIPSVVNGSKSHLRVPTQVHELCKAVKSKVEQRLAEDQQLMRKVQRVQRAQSAIQEEQRFGYKKNHSLVKKAKENGNSDTRCVSPAGSTGNCSTPETSTPPPPFRTPNVEQKKLLEREVTTKCPPPPPPLPAQGSTKDHLHDGRSALLSSIQSFSASRLRATINKMSLPGKVKKEDPTCKTFIFKGESHTFGNALRFIIMKNPEVKFCAYTLLHPTDDEFRLRIQTYGNNF
ncbi:hypothetical protein CHUAL_004921 [Chamberlinius hualienensis]